MPLVTITTTPIANTTALMLGPVFPSLLVNNLYRLGLDANTPEEGVQVKFEHFSEEDVNGVDMWINIVFTEHYPEGSKPIAVKETLKAIILTQIAECVGSMELPFTLAVDVFWTPGHGFIISGTTQHDW